jgi:hypothetical protein
MQNTFAFEVKLHEQTRVPMLAPNNKPSAKNDKTLFEVFN